LKKADTNGTLCNDSSAEMKKRKQRVIERIALFILTAASEQMPETLKKMNTSRRTSGPLIQSLKIMGTLHQGPIKNFVALRKGSVGRLLIKCKPRCNPAHSITDLTSTEKKLTYSMNPKDALLNASSRIGLRL